MSAHPANGRLYDEEAERRLISAVANAPEYLYPQAAQLTPESFGTLAAREAWRKLTTALRDGRVLDAGGYREFHDDLRPAPLDPAFVADSAGYIVELSVLRRARDLGTRLAQAATNYDGEQVKTLLESGPSILRGQAADTLQTARDVAGRVYDIVTQPGLLKSYILPLGLDALDTALGGGLEVGTASILMARPGMGKTAALVQISDLVSETGAVVVAFSKEMTAEQWLIRAACRRARVSWLDYKQGKIGEEQIESLQKWVMRLGDRQTLFIDDTTQQTTDGAWDICERVRHKTGRLDLVLADHLRLFADKADNENHRLGAISWGFKRLAKRLSTRVLIAAQINRGVESRTDKIPDLPDLRDSGEIEENADGVFALYRDDYYKPSNQRVAEFWIRKDRNGARNAVAKFAWLQDYMSFEALAR